MSTTTFLHLNAHKKIPIRDVTPRRLFLNGHDRFATACGLALQGLGLVPFDIDLLPQEKQGFFSRLKSAFSKKRPVAAWGMDIGNSCMKAVRLTFDEEGIPVVDQCYHCHYRFSDEIKREETPAVETDFAVMETQAMQVLQQAAPSPFARDEAPFMFKAKDLESMRRLAVEGFLHKYEYQGEAICVGYPSQNLICANITLEADTPDIAAKVIPFEFKNHLPFDEDQFLPNYMILGSDDGINGSMHQRAYLFSTRISTIENTLSLLGEFGIVPNLMTTNLLANLNYSTFLLMSPPVLQTPKEGVPSFDENHEPPEVRSVLVCDMGARGMDMVFYDLKEILHYYIPIGGDHFSKAIAESLDIPLVRAEGFKRDALGSGHGPEIVEALKPLVRQLVNEVMLRLDRLRKNDGKLDKVVVMGSGFQLQGFADYFCRVLEGLWNKPS